QARFLEDHLLTSSSIQPTDSLFLFNHDGTPAMSNLIEHSFHVPDAWKNYLSGRDSGFDSVRTVTIRTGTEKRRYLVVSAELPGLPMRGLLAKPYDVVFAAVMRSIQIEAAVLLLMLIASLFLSRYLAGYEVRLIVAR